MKITSSRLSFSFFLTGLSSSESSSSPGSEGYSSRSSCVSLRVGICHRHRVGYSHTSLPNSMDQVSQEKINQDFMQFDKLMGVKCYSLLPLFLCSIYAPKCIPASNSIMSIPPCRSLCKGKFPSLICKIVSHCDHYLNSLITFPTTEATRKCDFFLKVFTLKWPSSHLLDCNSLPDSPDPEICVGFREHQIVMMNLQGDYSATEFFSDFQFFLTFMKCNNNFFLSCLEQHAIRKVSDAMPLDVFPETGSAMDSLTVRMPLMRRTAHTALTTNITVGQESVLERKTFVMESKTVLTAEMRDSVSD